MRGYTRQELNECAKENIKGLDKETLEQIKAQNPRTKRLLKFLLS